VVNEKKLRIVYVLIFSVREKIVLTRIKPAVLKAVGVGCMYFGHAKKERNSAP